MELFKRIWQDDEGQDLVEYALLAALLSVVSIASLVILGPTIAAVWTDINGHLTPAT